MDWAAAAAITMALLALVALAVFTYWLGYRAGHTAGHHAGYAEGVWQAVRQIRATRHRPPS